MTTIGLKINSYSSKKYFQTLLILTVSKSMLVEVSEIFKSDLRLDMYRSPITVRSATEIQTDPLSFDVIGREGKISLKGLGKKRKM